MIQIFEKILNCSKTAAEGFKKTCATLRDKLIAAKTCVKSALVTACRAVFCNRYMVAFGSKCKEIAVFLDDNRKIWYPIIMVLYTLIVVSVTLTVDHAHMINKITAENERKLAQEMANPATQSSLVRLTEGTPYSAENQFTLQYEGCNFDKIITPSKAEKFGAYYENQSESNLYMDVMITYTNMSSQSIRCDEAAKMIATCAGVDYNCFAAVETEQGTNFEFAADTQISAGESVLIHYIFDVPSTMKNTNHGIVAELIAHNKSYYIDIR